MSTLTLKKLVRTLAFSFLAGCGVKTATLQHKDLDPVVDPNSANEAPPSTDSSALPTRIPNLKMTSCEYWASLPTANSTDTQVFQMVDGLELRQPSAKAKKTKRSAGVTGVAFGKHNLSHLPQVLYKLAAETAPEGGRKKLDPPSIDESMKIVEEKRHNREVPFLKYYKAEAAYKLGMTSKLVAARNEAIVEQVEKSLPGVFTNNSGPLTNDLLLADLLPSIGVKGAQLEDIFSKLQILQKATPLFVSKSWSERRSDLELSLEILNRDASRSKLSIQEKVCRFAISHRLTAQLLSIKGIRGAPRLLESGLLHPIPAEDKAIFPETNINGSFGVVVDKKWIGEQLETPSVRPENAASTSDYLDALSYVATLTWYRSPLLWSLAGQAAPAGQLRIPSDLLKLGIGLFGIEMKVLAKDELVLTVPDRILVREDNANNLAKLGMIAMDVADSFAGLATPNSIESALLTPEMCASFTDDYPVGLVARMNRLTAGLVFEGISRVENGQGSDELKVMLHKIGRRLGNRRLQEI